MTVTRLNNFRWSVLPYCMATIWHSSWQPVESGTPCSYSPLPDTEIHSTEVHSYEALTMTKQLQIRPRIRLVPPPVKL